MRGREAGIDGQQGMSECTYECEYVCQSVCVCVCRMGRGKWHSLKEERIKKEKKRKKKHQRIHRLCVEENKSTSVVFL